MLFLHLAHEAALLVYGVVELREGVAVLVAADEEFKTLREEGVVRLALRKRGVLHGIVIDEYGLDEAVLALLLEDGVEHLALCGLLPFRHRNAHGGGAGPCVLVRLPCVIVRAGVLFHGFLHGEPWPGGGHAYLRALVCYCLAAAHVAGYARVHALHEIHHGEVIAVCLVHLNGGELGVVVCVHSLVAEDAAHFVHPLHASYDEALEVQLRLYAQVHVQRKGVEPCLEGARRGAYLYGQKDGRVHFNEALPVQKGAYLLEYAGARHESALHVRVDDEVQVPLAVPYVRIREAVLLLRKRPQALREHLYMRAVHGCLAGLRLEDDALDAYDVPYVVILLEGGIGVFAHVIPADVHLYLAFPVLDMRKGGLAHDSPGHKPARNADLFAFQPFKAIQDVL